MASSWKIRVPMSLWGFPTVSDLALFRQRFLLFWVDGESL